MINSTLGLIHLFPVMCFGYLLSVSVFLYIAPISIVVVLIAVYFIMDKYKKNFAFKKDALMKKITQLSEENKILSKELAGLKIILEESEKQKHEWDQEKQSLIHKIEELENQIVNLKMNEIAKKDDIIIEYYLNEKYGE